MITHVNNISYLAIESGQHHTVGVSVSVDVDTKPTQAFWVDGNMAQDHAIHDMVGTQFTEVFTIVSVLENIVVSPDQDLVTVEPAHYAQGLAVDHHIAQVIYFVVWPYFSIPRFDHKLVHFFWSVKWSQLCYTIVTGKMAHTFVSKVRVAD
jgi:hypothetical protein